MIPHNLRRDRRQEWSHLGLPADQMIVLQNSHQKAAALIEAGMGF